jgi:hypothetical protein
VDVDQRPELDSGSRTGDEEKREPGWIHPAQR